ncbi:MAG: twin transmembrane helix small protein [Gammaproteobacteria bacterium]|nr:twin transmembrane helix small protein [Gammaproteobacteria bacterium]
MPFIFKIIIVSLLLLVLFSLGSALVAMVKGDTSDKMVKSLTWRIGLSVFIFVLLIIGQATGVITSHGL